MKRFAMLASFAFVLGACSEVTNVFPTSPTTKQDTVSADAEIVLSPPLFQTANPAVGIESLNLITFYAPIGSSYSASDFVVTIEQGLAVLNYTAVTKSADPRCGTGTCSTAVFTITVDFLAIKPGYGVVTVSLAKNPKVKSSFYLSVYENGKG